MDIKASQTDKQALKLQARCGTLRSKIVQYLKKEKKILPSRCVYVQEPSSEEILADNPELYTIPFPSAFLPHVRYQAFPDGIVDAEQTLRRAEAIELLFKIQYHLRVQTFVNAFRAKHIRGQEPNTRYRGLQAQVDDKVQMHMYRYRHSRERYLRLLGPSTDIDVSLQELRDEDVWGLSQNVLRRHELEQENRTAQERATGSVVSFNNDVPEEWMNSQDDPGKPSVSSRHEVARSKLGEGKRTLSWIWYTAASSDDNPMQMHEGMSFGFLFQTTLTLFSCSDGMGEGVCTHAAIP